MVASQGQSGRHLKCHTLPKNNVAKNKSVIATTIFSNGLEMNKKDIQSRY
jgi:hypothetical protein